MFILTLKTTVQEIKLDLLFILFELPAFMGAAITVKFVTSHHLFRFVSLALREEMSEHFFVETCLQELVLLQEKMQTRRSLNTILFYSKQMSRLLCFHCADDVSKVCLCL